MHSDGEQKLRINVDNGLTIVEADLRFLSTDDNSGVDPAVGGAACRNGDDDPQTGAELYSIDVAHDVVVEFPVASGGTNGGAMLTVSALRVPTDAALVFDIVGTLNGTAYALLSESKSGKSTGCTNILQPDRSTRVGLLAQTKSYLISIAVAPEGAQAKT